MRFLKTTGLTTVILALAGAASAQTIHIKDARIVTNSQIGTIENGSLLIEDGQITTIGQNLETPDGATVIEADGQWVTPGLFIPYSNLAMAEVSLESSTNDIRSRDSKTSISEYAVDGFNPNSPIIGNTRIEGITHAAVMMQPGKRIFSGIGLIADTRGQFDSVIDDAAFVNVQMGSGGASTAGGSRPAAMAELRAALDDAKAYPRLYSGPDDGDTLSRRDAAALANVISGEIPVLVGADRASDILRLIELGKDYPQIDMIIVGAAEGWMVASEMQEAGLKAMVDPHQNLPGSFDRVGSRLDNIVLLDEAGVDYVITSRSADTNHNIRVLPQHAGNAVGNGLDWGKAFAAISSTPARWFGVPELGQLEPQTTANLVVWDGDPLEITSSPIRIMIDGEDQSLESRQTALRDRYAPDQPANIPHKYR